MYPEIPVRTKLRFAPYLMVALIVWVWFGDPSGHATSGKARHEKPPSVSARADIPARYLTLYRKAGARYRVPWSVLAAIGKVESDHGRSRAPGTHSGVNRFGCCAGPMQFNIRNGPHSTWDRYGHGSPYRPEDAIPAAARMLRANGVLRDLGRAVYSYNHSWAYVARVRATARRYQKG